MIDIPLKTSSRNQLVDITNEVQNAVLKTKVKNGLCVVYCPHTSAAIAITEGADPNVAIDIVSKLSELVPKYANFLHEEGNSDAHVKSSIIGNSRIVVVKDGKLVLGTFERIFFCEFDGPRDRKPFVVVLAE